MRIGAQSIGVGWLPCLPYDYNPLWGEPNSQCNSISDQTPCITGEGPLAAQGYCPSTMAGGYGGMGVLPLCGPGLRLHPSAAVCVPDDSAVFEGDIPSAGANADFEVNVTGCIPDMCVTSEFPWIGHRTENPKGGSPACVCKPEMYWVVGGVLIVLAVFAIMRR